MSTDTPYLRPIAAETSRLEDEITQPPEFTRDRRFFDILFRSEEYKKIADAQLALVTTQIEYRRQALVMFANLRIEELRQHCESEAQVRGYSCKLSTEQHIRKLVAEREAWANQEVDRFLQNYEAAVERMERIRVPQAKAKEQQRLDQTLEAFFDTIDYFNEQFRKSLNFQAATAIDAGAAPGGLVD
jgi:uncharacterized FlaG/YvyC family protein